MPSHAHERRRTLLEAIADVAGYRLTMALPNGSFPDVLRFHVDRTGLFLGEAKHTERPYDVHSIDRLRGYLGWLAPLSRPGLGSVLAVAHPAGVRREWRGQLEWLCRDLRIVHVAGSTRMTIDTSVTFAVLSAIDRQDLLPQGKAGTRRSPHSAA